MAQFDLPDAAYPRYTATSQQPPPPTVRRAVLLMRVGALLTAANGLVNVVGALVTGEASNIYRAAHGGSSTANGTGFETGYIGGYAVWYLALAALWLWMAQANRGGKKWARITGAVFFGLSCLLLPGALTMDSRAGGGQGGGLAVAAFAVSGLTWVAGLATVILLWQRKSARHFKPVAASNPASVSGSARPVRLSHTTMDGISQHQPMADPWSTPGTPGT